jgi:hypothetical protein
MRHAMTLFALLAVTALSAGDERAEPKTARDWFKKGSAEYGERKYAAAVA